MFCATSLVFTGASIDKAYADDGLNIKDEITMTYYPKWKDGNSEELAPIHEVTIDIDSVKSTNSSIASIFVDDYDYNDGYGSYFVVTKKPGKATLTFDAKASDSDIWVSKTVKVTVNKWVKPCKTFKIGKKNYAKKFKKNNWGKVYKKASGKLVIKPKKGWKIVSIEKWIDKKQKTKKIKNKKKVKLALYDEIIVNFKKKGKDVYEYIVLTRYE